MKREAYLSPSTPDDAAKCTGARQRGSTIGSPEKRGRPVVTALIGPRPRCWSPLAPPAPGLLSHDQTVVRPWLIDELAYSGPEHRDPAFVAGYDHKQGKPDPSEDLAVLQAHVRGRTSTLIDMGAGTGRFAIAAARDFGRVVAIDVSPVMMSVLRKRAAEAGLSNLHGVQAGFLSYDHSGPPVDAVYSRNALHHLPDFWKAVALDRIGRMLKPNGVLRLHDLIYDFQPSQADDVLSRWLDGAVDDPTKGYTREDFSTHIRTEHSTFRWLLEPMLAAAGLEIVTADFRQSVYGAYTCVKG